MVDARVGFCLLAGLMGMGAVSCSDHATPVDTSRSNSPIVNGSVESGWVAVGALTELVPGLGIAGAHCTATAVHASWVLTSASCLEEHDPKSTLLYVGENANPDDTGRPASGSLHSVDAFYPNPGFEPQTGMHNIALVHLAQPLPGAVAPVPPSS